MTTYRLRFLPSAGRPAHSEPLEAESDGVALQLARIRVRDEGKCELWRNDRLVARIDAAASALTSK